MRHKKNFIIFIFKAFISFKQQRNNIIYIDKYTCYHVIYFSTRQADCLQSKTCYSYYYKIVHMTKLTLVAKKINQLCFLRNSCLIQNRTKEMLNNVQSDNDASLCRERFTTRISEFLSSERLKLTRLPRLTILSHVSPLLHQKLRKHWSLKCVYLQIVICKLLYSKEWLGR